MFGLGGWSAMFGTSTTVPETTAYIHEPGLWSAHWTYDTYGEVHRLSCMHIHDSRRKAEDCARQTNAQVERMLRERNDKVIGANYVAGRLYRHPTYQYLGVHKETDID